MNDLTTELNRSFFHRHPEAAARILNEMDASSINNAFLGHSDPVVANVLSKLEREKVDEVLAKTDDARFAGILLSLDPVVAGAVLARMDPGSLQNRIAALPAQISKEFEGLVRYPVGSAGSMMDRNVLAFETSTPIQKVLQKIRQQREKRVYEIFLVDLDGRLISMVPLQGLLATPDDEILKNIPQKDVVSVNVFASQEEVAEIFEEKKVTTLPVVNMDGFLLGVIGHSKLVSTAERDAAADIVTMVGANPEERAFSSPLFAVRKRLPWLSINLLTAFLASAVVGVFEGTIAKITALAVLLPVVAGQSGNTGAQAMAVTMRGLALREIRVRNWLRVVLKESQTGLLNGIAVALMTSLSVFFWSSDPALSCVIGVAMITSMIIASIAGAIIPILLTAAGKDPAQSSSIVLTTVTDVIGFSSFLGLATIFASLLVHAQ